MRRIEHRAGRLAAAATVLVVAATWVYFAGRLLVVSVPVSDPDLIVSLASHEWERLPAAADLAARFPRAAVLLTQPVRVTVFTCHDCPNRVGRLERLGVPASRVQLVPLAADGTRAEAWAVRALARHQQVRRLVVVTSPYHTRRALAAFRAAFAGQPVQVGVQPATCCSPARPARWLLAPYDRWYVAYEWAAMAYYAVWHRIWPT